MKEDKVVIQMGLITILSLNRPLLYIYRYIYLFLNFFFKWGGVLVLLSKHVGRFRVSRKFFLFAFYMYCAEITTYVY